MSWCAAVWRRRAEMTSGVEIDATEILFGTSGSGSAGAGRPAFAVAGRTVTDHRAVDEQQETYRQLGLFGDVFNGSVSLMSTRLRTRN